MEGLSKAKQYPTYKPTTLCEVCANAYGGCSWSEKDVQLPVEGWDAIRHDIGLSETHRGEARRTLTESYVVLACPQFKLEEQHRWAYDRFDPEAVRAKMAESRRSGLHKTKPNRGG